LGAVEEGRFREDLLARINLWTFTMPGLRDRHEDVEPNLQFELDQYAEKTGTRVTFNREARNRFLDFALSPSATWKGILSEAQRGQALERLQHARKFIGTQDPLDFFRSWKTPSERYKPMAERNMQRNTVNSEDGPGQVPRCRATGKPYARCVSSANDTSG